VWPWGRERYLTYGKGGEGSAQDAPKTEDMI